MLSRLSPVQKGILIAILGFSAFVVSDSASKWLSQHYSVFQVVAWVYAFSLLFCVLGSPFLGGLKQTLKTKKLKFHLARGIANFGLAVSVVYAFQNLPLTSVYPILFLSPFLMSILAGIIYKETVRKIEWVVIGIGFSGVLIAFRPGFEVLDPWLLVALFTSLCISAFGLCARALGENETLMSLAFYPSICNTILLSPFLLQGFPATEDLPLFFVTGLMLCLGMMGVAYAYRLARYAVISPLQYLQLVMAFGVGYIVFDERPDGWMIAGSLVIVTSGVLLALTHNKTIEVAPQGRPR